MSRPPSNTTGSEIAIVGLSLRVPGARTADQFWHNLRHGVESITVRGDDDLRAAGVPDQDLGDPRYVRSSAILDDMESWDAPFFGFSPKDASIMDPQHRLFLECAWEGLEDAGHLPEGFGGSIGVFAGCGMQAYMMFNLLPNRKLIDEVGLFLVRHTGNDKDFLSTRVSYSLNLQGPSINVQTACSTSLAAVHLATQSLLSGECDMALAGGVTIMLPHRVGYKFEEGEILSPDGHCRPFDADAQGTVFGSGAGVVVLRRLEDALADSDHVYAVIRGSALNNDGSSKVSYLAPSVDGQSAAIAEALGIADVDPASVSFVEAHGTGTPVGDPIEVKALTLAYASTDREHRCALGSVKSNIGHLDTAAGVISLAKAVLALKHEVIPATLHYRAPNPAIDFATGPFYVNAEPQPWPRNSTPRRAGVSSLGVGGTNVHIILEEAPLREGAPPVSSPQLLCVSARSVPALRSASSLLADHLEAEPASLSDAAYTLAVGRRAFRERRAVLCTDLNGAVNTLRASDDRRRSVSGTAPAAERDVAFMFAGGGVQHPGMGRSLYENERVYRDVFDECLTFLDPDCRAAVQALISGDMASPTLAAQMERPSLGLPALLTCQIAMAHLVMSWGLRPSAMIGHSMGEYSAAHLAGVFSLRDALRLVQERGRLFETLPRGGMLAVPMPAGALRALVGSRLSVAADNAPDLSVASGPVEDLHALDRDLRAQDIECSRIRIDVAAHSNMLEGILAEFRRFVATIRLSPPTIPFVSNLTGGWIRNEDTVDPDYWVQHLRQTVQFSAGIKLLLSDPARAFLEIGPGRTLATLARMNATPGNHTVIVTSMRAADDVGVSDRDAALLGAGELWCHGARVDLTAMHAGATHRRIPLPTYAFERTKHWIDAPRASLAAVEDAGTRRPLDEWFYVADWQRTLGIPAPSTESETRASGITVLLDDDTLLGQAIGEELRDRKRTVVNVRRGCAFARDGGTAFTIDPGSADDFNALIEALAGMSNAAPLRFLQLWTLDGGRGTEERPKEEREERSFYSFLRLAQAWGRHEVPSPGEVVLLSNRLWSVGGEVSGSPWAALALGPIRVLPAEFPTLRTRAIDVGWSGAGPLPRGLARQVADEIDQSEVGEIAIRGGERWRRVFRRVPLPPAVFGVGSPLKARGVYLITGAFGGIGTLLAERLAREFKARLVLVGRRASGPRVQEMVSRCSDLGAEVLTIAADVADESDATRVAEEARRRFGRLDGVFHAAGILDDGLIQLRSDARCAAVLAPKVRGTVALDEAVGDDVDLFVLFSSISAEAGLPGQVDYAAASAFLDAFAAHRRERRPGLTVSVQWGTWSDVGMTAAGSGRVSADGVEEPLSHPLLTSRLSANGTHTFLGTLGCDTHWLVGQHRLSTGHALIPGTGYLELACAAFSMSAVVPTMEIRDVAFLSPFIVKDGEPRAFKVTLQDRDDVTNFSVLGIDPGGTDWSPHASGVIGRGEPMTTPSPAALVEIRARCSDLVDGAPDLSSHPFLNLGSRWNCIREVRYGHGEALGHLRLPDDYRAETEMYRLHPALLDMATACAQRLVPDFDPASDFYVPLSYTRLRSFAPMPPEVYSHIRVTPSELDPHEVAVFDVAIYDGAGGAVADIEGFMMARVADKAALVAPSHRRRPAAAVESGPARRRHAGAARRFPVAIEGIKAEEGINALFRIIDAGAPSSVTVTWREPGSVIQELHRLATPAPAAGEAADTPAPEAVTDVEAALIEHGAVAQCAAVARLDGGGAVRVVAYVVFSPDEQATVSELRRFTKQRVQDDHVPSSFVVMDALPTRDGGELDRGALPDPYGVRDEHVAPRTEVEHLVAETWKDVLGVDKVSVHDNFFDIGGHSLLAVRVVTRLDRKLGVRLSQAAMVLQTLEQIAAECERQRAGEGALRPA